MDIRDHIVYETIVPGFSIKEKGSQSENAEKKKGRLAEIDSFKHHN